MTNRLHVVNAIKIAENRYFEDGMKADFMAVATLSDSLIYAQSQSLSNIDGIKTNDMIDALITLSARNQHSTTFFGLIEQGRVMSERYVSQDDQTLGDLKHWNIMSRKERIASCTRFAEAVRDIFVSHVGLPPDRKILVAEAFAVDEYCRFAAGAASDSGYDLTKIPFTARAQKSTPRSPSELIFVNTYHESGFDNPYATYSAVFGAYVNIIQQNLGGIVRSKFQENLETLDHDRAMWHLATQEKAFIDPVLYDLHAMQFSTTLIDSHEVQLEVGLQEIVESHSDHIPERIKISLRDKVAMGVGRFFGHPGL